MEETQGCPLKLFYATKFSHTNWRWWLCRRYHKENVICLEFARDGIKKTQVQQKQQDVCAHSATYVEGERVFAHMSGTAYKLARQYFGPHSVVQVLEKGIKVRPVDQPPSTTTCVALNRVRWCPDEIPDVFCPQKDTLASSLGPTQSSKETWTLNETICRADRVDKPPATMDGNVLKPRVEKCETRL